jgi:3-hydroxyisobutyrate dehydrogenase-like beta-hydroxyacid dehydrogenase
MGATRGLTGYGTWGGMNTSFIGLGSMGLPMARNLLKSGHELAVYNRSRNRADELVEMGARVMASPREAASAADVLITMLADDAAVESVIFGRAGAIGGLGKGAVHVSMSTIGHVLSRRLAAEHRAQGQHYVSAPVFGRPEAAEAAKLWIVAAGAADQIARCRPLFEAMGQGTEIVGDDPAMANVLKLAGNFLLASAIEAMGEAFALVRKHGLEPKRFLEIVNGKLIRSPVYENYGTLIATERWEPAGFKLRHGLKDVRLALAAAEDVNAPMPLASLIRDQYLTAMARNWGDIDWAALARVVAVNAGLD